VLSGLPLFGLAIVVWLSSGGPLPAVFSPSAERTLYFKLPIEGAQFHWKFLEADALLAGELTLRIINKDRDQTFVVFRAGTIADRWQMIGTTDRDGGVYFGFSTTDRFLTAPSDSLIITLTAANDLLGQGTYNEGVLPAGTWQMTGTYSVLYGGLWNPFDYLGGSIHQGGTS